MAEDGTRIRRDEIAGADIEETEESFRKDLVEQTPQTVHEAHLDSEAASDDKAVMDRVPELTDDELARLSILEPGTPLEQGAVYLDLNNRARGPFRAIGGMEAEPQQKLIAKSMTDYELWNVLARDQEPEVERPDTQ